AMQGMLDRLHDTTGLHTELRTDATLPALTPDAEVALLRTAQSSLGNIREPCAATMTVLTLIDSTDAIRLDIIYDGVGFDLSGLGVSSEQRSASSYGLRFMRARLRELGGGLYIESSPGQGTELSAYLPVNPGMDSRPVTQENT